MNIKDIPLIIPNFNQLYYLRNLINQLRFYYPENPIIVLDNGSNHKPLLEFYDTRFPDESSYLDGNNIQVIFYHVNEFVNNLSDYLNKINPEYYVITDPDLSIPPTVPPCFLEIFKSAIDNHGFHHAGFGLRVDDIPSWNPKAGWIQGDEKALLNAPVIIQHEGKDYQGYRAPLDTTFCLFKRDNGGWKAPMDGAAWSNSVRLFEVQHLPWYLHKDYLNDEMKHYFATCKKRVLGAVTAGSNHYNPYNGMD